MLRARHVEVAPHPENRYELGAALARAGRSADAQVEWQAFETAARAEMSGWDNANVELDLLLRGPRRAACRGAGHRQARGGAPPRRQDARGPRLGAPGERPIERSED